MTRLGPRGRGVYPWVRADPGLVPEAVAKLQRFAMAWRALLHDIDDVLGTRLSAGWIQHTEHTEHTQSHDSPEPIEPTQSHDPSEALHPASPDGPDAAPRGSPGSASASAPLGLLVAAALESARDALERFARVVQEPGLTMGTERPLSLLADADGRCRTELEHAAARLPIAGIRPWLDLGVEPPADPVALAADPDRLRLTLGGWSAADVAAVLAAYPGLADALCEPTDTKPPYGAVWPSGTAPAAALDTAAQRRPQSSRTDRAGRPDHGASFHPDQGASFRRVVAVRARLGGRDLDEVRRWGLLWPELLGNLDGAPLPIRFEANRLRLRHALAASIDADRRHDEEDLRRRAEPDRRFAGACAAFRGAWSSRDALSSVWSPAWMAPWQARNDARVRVRLLESMLHQSQDQVRWEPTSRRTPEGYAPGRRQVLLLDLAGRGRLAELRGTLDAHTEHLAVVVPGTGTALRGFHMPVGFATDLVAADPRGRVAALAWMGCDLPQAFANESPLARFALVGGPRLRDVVEALDPPVRMDVTVIGHSYGGALVGAAERLGLRVDKVVHLASAGAGPGVVRVEDYPAVDPLGRPRRVRRWCLTAPGDPIDWARRADLFGRLRRLSARRDRFAGLLHRAAAGRSTSRFAAFDLGVNPALLAGMTILPAGRWERDDGRHQAGDPVRGLGAHTDVTNPATGAFQAMARVVTAL